MSDQCKNCPLLFCDFVRPECRLTPAEIAKMPLLVRGYDNRTQYDTRHKRADEERIALSRIKANPDGVFAIRRMRRLAAANARNAGLR